MNLATKSTATVNVTFLNTLPAIFQQGKKMERFTVHLSGTCTTATVTTSIVLQLTGTVHYGAASK